MTRQDTSLHARSVANLRPATDASQHFVIHLEICNPHRLRRAIALARSLMAGGHSAVISYEKQIAFRFAPDDRAPTVWDSGATVAAARVGSVGLALRALETWCGDGPQDPAAAQLRRADVIADLLTHESPSYLIIWSGNFDYQTGTLEGAARAGYADRTIFCEVGWLPQQEYLYFDLSGVNARSTLVGLRPGPLSPGQTQVLDTARARLRIARGGTPAPQVRPKSVFVPLQIETDTSFRMGSPFATNAEFVDFLCDWLPPDYHVTAKLHPKERVRNAPIHARRRNMRVVKAGSLDRMMLSAETVIGINSTALIEAAMLDKRTIAFGQGLFNGTGVLTEATPADAAPDVLRAEVDPGARDAFLFELLYRRQVSLAALERADYDHLASRIPFDQILAPRGTRDGDGRFVETMKKGISMIRVGKSRVARSAILDVEKGGEIAVGDDSEIRHGAVLEVSGRYNGSIRIGDHSVIGIGSWLQGSGRIDIGDDVIIGPYAAIVSTNHRYEDVETPIARQPLETGEITIEDDVWLGAHVTVAANVRIGAHSIIGANAFVNSDIPPYSVAVGSPARVIRSRK